MLETRIKGLAQACKALSRIPRMEVEYAQVRRLLNERLLEANIAKYAVVEPQKPNTLEDDQPF